MNRQTAREKAASADATTPSARALANIARKAFLSFWSYLNIFTDAGRAGQKSCRHRPTYTADDVRRASRGVSDESLTIG